MSRGVERQKASQDRELDCVYYIRPLRPPPPRPFISPPLPSVSACLRGFCLYIYPTIFHCSHLRPTLFFVPLSILPAPVSLSVSLGESRLTRLGGGLLGGGRVKTARRPPGASGERRNSHTGTGEREHSPAYQIIVITEYYAGLYQLVQTLWPINCGYRTPNMVNLNFQRYSRML